MIEDRYIPRPMDMTRAGPSLRRLIPYEEFDYLTLLVALSGYSRPRDKITDLLRKGTIIRVRKGLYVFGQEYRQHPFSREILANLIYGPSYISLEYALHYHGLIPESVEAVTSVTCGRSRRFRTPVGLFTYRSIPLQAFHAGMNRIELNDGRAFLMAGPEKALADKIRSDRKTDVGTQKSLQEYLTGDLRIDTEQIVRLDAARMAEIGCSYRSRRIRLVSELIRRLHQIR